MNSTYMALHFLEKALGFSRWAEVKLLTGP
jgi:hypothetical protein